MATSFFDRVLSSVGLVRASYLDNPSNWADLNAIWERPYKSRSGETVTPHRALMFSPVWQAVNLISGDVAKLPFNIYRRTPEVSKSARDVDKDHSAHLLVRRSPYPSMSAFKFWRRLMVHALIWNNAYALIRRENGRPVQMLPLLPDRTCPYDFEGECWYRSEINGTVYTFAPSEIFHIEGISIEGKADCELIAHARDSWGLGLSAENFASKFFERGGRMGGVVSIPDSRKVDKDALAREFRRTYESPGSAFMAFIAADGVRFDQAQFAAKDVQLVEARAEAVRDVARWYNLPPHKLGDNSRTSYNSLEQENLSYTSGTLSHWLETIAAEAWMKLLSSDEQAADSHFFEHQVDKLLQLDAKTRTEIAVMEIGARTMSPNEYRDKLNRPPYEGGDTFENPATSSPFTNNQQNDEPDDEPEMESDEEETPDTRAAMIEAVTAAADRAAKLVASQISREVSRKKPTRFCSWFDSKESQHFQMAADEFSSVRSLMKCHGLDWNQACLAVVTKVRAAVDEVLETTSSEPEELIAAIREAMDRVTESQEEIVTHEVS